MSDEERDEQQAVVDMLRATRRAAEVGVVGDATGAATALWRALNGVDLATATPGQMIDLDASQQAAILQGRAQLKRILDARPEWSP